MEVTPTHRILADRAEVAAQQVKQALEVQQQKEILVELVERSTVPIMAVAAVAEVHRQTALTVIIQSRLVVETAVMEVVAFRAVIQDQLSHTGVEAEAKEVAREPSEVRAVQEAEAMVLMLEELLLPGQSTEVAAVELATPVPEAVPGS